MFPYLWRRSTLFKSVMPSRGRLLPPPACQALGMSTPVGSAPRDDDQDPWRLKAALDGDAEAWAFLVDHFTAQIWRWSRNCGLDHEDSLDVAQTVWLRLKDKGAGIEDPRRLPGWLATTTKRLAIETRNRRKRTVAADLTATEHGIGDPMFAVREPSPGQHSIADDERQRLASAFMQLSEQCRDLLAMSWRHFSYADIAAALEISVGSVGPSRGRCLDRLREGAGIDEV